MKNLVGLLMTLTLLNADVIQLESKTLEETLKSENVVVDFYAEWCGPCKKFAPIFEKVAGSELEKSKLFAKVNIDKEGELCDKFKVRSVPTILFLKNGKEVARHVGYLSEKELSLQIKKHFSAGQLRLN